jgi:hypothetical protein
MFIGSVQEKSMPFGGAEWNVAVTTQDQFRPSERPGNKNATNYKLNISLLPSEDCGSNNHAEPQEQIKTLR